MGKTEPVQLLTLGLWLLHFHPILEDVCDVAVVSKSAAFSPGLQLLHL